MRESCSVAALCALLVAACPQLGVAQSVPRPLQISYYGSASLWETSVDPLVALAVNPSGQVVMTGGFSGDAAILLVAGAPALIPIPPLATLLVSSPVVPILGVFDDSATFVAPFALTMPGLEGLEGLSLYMQGIHVIAPETGGGLSLSQGMQVKFLPVRDPGSQVDISDKRGEGDTSTDRARGDPPPRDPVSPGTRTTA